MFLRHNRYVIGDKYHDDKYQRHNLQGHLFQSDVPWEASSAAWGIYRPLPASTLYVFENLELELSLTTISVETDEPIIDDYTCLVRLQKGMLDLRSIHF